MKKLSRLCAAVLAISLCAGTAAFAEEEAAVGFEDVKETDYFYPAVSWAVESGITEGVDESHFDPDGTVDRAQIVTFLWRMADKPQPSETKTFSDVEKDSWYEDAVKWAVENTITVGTDEDRFSPDTTCDRAMCITLLYRLMGSTLDGIDLKAVDEIDENSSIEDLGVMLVKKLIEQIGENGLLVDVPEDSYYKLPVVWACLNNIITEDNTGAMEDGLIFRSEEPCTRKEMISFLYQTKLMQDKANEPATFEFGAVTVPIPQKYMDILAFDVNATPDDEDGVLITVSELASKKATEEQSGEAGEIEGAGELFRIERISEDALKEMLCGEMSGVEVFARDSNGKYYLFVHPTDVRFARGSNEEMEKDADIWTELNAWANGEVRNDIIKASKDLGALTYTNTLLDMYLARIAYRNDLKYTISTTEFGPIEPGDFDGSEYAQYLLDGNFIADEEAEAPDGEYIVLDFPEENIRFDFFAADKDLVREVREGYTVFYRRAVADQETNTDTMQKWYYAIAKMAGKDVKDE